MQVREHITSEAEEMYIITVARAVEDGDGPPVSMSTVAKALDVSPVSANQMIKKLDGLGLVSYTPYKGVSLTAEGEELANVVLRNRRLWGVFLVDHLGLSARRADEVACEMEHVTPGEVADRLSDFLGNPSIGPEGRPIPPARTGSDHDGRHLSDLAAGTSAVIEHVAAAYAAFLGAQGLEPGVPVEVMATGPDGSVLLDGPNGPVHCTSGVARGVRVAD